MGFRDLNDSDYKTIAAGYIGLLAFAGLTGWGAAYLTNPSKGQGDYNAQHVEKAPVEKDSSVKSIDKMFLDEMEGSSLNLGDYISNRDFKSGSE